jgi:hypothetical protein
MIGGGGFNLHQIFNSYHSFESLNCARLLRHHNIKNNTMSDIDNKMNDSLKQIDDGFEKYKEASRQGNPILTNQTCGWTMFYQICAFISCLIFIAGLIQGGNNGFFLAISGVCGALGCLVSGYVIQLLFDCRRYLEVIAKKQS